MIECTINIKVKIPIWPQQKLCVSDWPTDWVYISRNEEIFWSAIETTCLKVPDVTRNMHAIRTMHVEEWSCMGTQSFTLDQDHSGNIVNICSNMVTIPVWLTVCLFWQAKFILFWEFQMFWDFDHSWQFQAHLAFSAGEVLVLNTATSA